METMKNRNKSTLVELSALIKWSLLRHKSLLPVFTATQAFLSVAIVYGLALLIILPQFIYLLEQQHLE